MRSLFKKKSIEECLHCNNQKRRLKRSLGSKELIIMGIGAIIGAGIFIITGIASAKYSGPALIVSFIISAVACILTAFCYAEFASMIPISGSVYTYTYVALGEIWAWMIGWILMFEYLISSSAIAVGWSSYVVGLLNSGNYVLPQIITNPPGIGLINLPALIIVGILTGILIIGTRESAKFNSVIVVIKLAVIALFIIIGSQFINPLNYQPFIPYGWSGILQGAAMVFFAYIGFDAVSTAAEEAKNPQRSLPVGIIGSLIICSILYIIVAAVLNGMVPYNLLDNAAPVAYALEVVGANWAASIVSIGALFGLTSVLLTLLFGQTRIFYSMSKDGLLPGFFSKIHPNFHTPVISTLIVGSIAAIIAAFFPLNLIVELVNIGTLSAFIFLALSVIILRKQQPEIPRKFKCPLVPLIPILSIISCGFLILQLKITTLEYFMVSLVIGLGVYFIYGINNSKLRAKDNNNNEFNYEIKGYKFPKRDSK